MNFWVILLVLVLVVTGILIASGVYGNNLSVAQINSFERKLETANVQIVSDAKIESPAVIITLTNETLFIQRAIIAGTVYKVAIPYPIVTLARFYVFNEQMTIAWSYNPTGGS